jgi:hypothetical protein
MYEFFKRRLSYVLYDKPSSLRPFEASLCGSVAGGIAAVLTTPLDVLKTRVMLDLRVRKTDFSSEICLPVLGPFSSFLPISSPPNATDISLRRDPCAVRWCHTENHVDLGGWGRVFGYVRVDNRYLGFVNPKPAVSILATILIKCQPLTTALVDSQFTKIVRPTRFGRTFQIFFFIVTAVSSLSASESYMALLEHRNRLIMLTEVFQVGTIVTSCA